MVKGHPNNIEEAKPFLDSLVRETFLFMKDHSDQVMGSQPDRYNRRILNREFSQELTDNLIDKEVVSKEYKVVLSGPQPENDASLKDGNYTLVVYETTDSKNNYNLEEKKNVELRVQLSGVDIKTMDYTVAKYDLVGASVFFEEQNLICMGLIKNREISITQRVDFNQPSCYLWGERDNNGKDLPLFDASGNLIDGNLQAHHQKSVKNHPAGTVYRQGELKNRVDVFMPEMR